MDTHEQQQLESLLETTNAWLRKLSRVVEQSPSLIVITDLNGTIEYINPSFSRITGYRLEEAMGQNTRILSSRELDPEEYATLWSTIRAGQEWRGEFHNRRKNGEFYWASAIISPIKNEAGEITHFLGLQEDITERKLVQEALRKSEERYELAASAGKVGVWDWNLETNEFYLAPNVKSMLGYENDEIANQLAEIHAQIHPDDLPIALAAEQAHLEGLTPHYEAEYRMRHKDGSYRWILARGTAFHNEAGQPYRMAGTNTDITDLKQAEEARLQAEEKYRSIFENATDGIFQTTPEGQYISANPMLAQIYGYASPEELIASISNIARQLYVLPDRRAEFIRILEGQAELSGFESQIYRKDGSIIWISENARVVRDETGRVLHYEGAVSDITIRKMTEEALRESEERYRAIFEQSRDVIYISARGGEMLAVNQAGLELFGYTRTEMIGMNMIKLYVNPEERPKFQQEIERRGAVRDYDMHFKRKDGTSMHCQITASIWRNHASGQIEGYQGIIRDITRRKQAEEALQKAFRRTQALYRIGDALVAGTDQRTTFENVLGEYLSLLNLKRGGLMLFNQNSLYHKVEALYIDGQPVEPILTFIIKDDLIAKHLHEHPTPLIIEDAATHPLTAATQEFRGEVKTMLLIPILMQEKVVGVIGADSTEDYYDFTETEIEVGKAVAGQLGIWLQNRLLLAEAQRRSTLLQTAAEVSRAASSILDLDQLINTSVNLIREQFNFYYVGLFMVDDQDEWAVLRSGTGEAGRIQLEKGHRLRIGGGSMIGWSVEHRRARIALDVGEDAVWFNNPYLPDTHSEMALPLIARDRAIGALTVQSVERGAFSSEDVTLLQTMADQLANAIDNARLYENAAQARAEAEERLQESLALQELSQTLARTLQVNEIMGIFFDACTGIIGFDYIQLATVDKYEHRVKALAGKGVSDTYHRSTNHSLDSPHIMAYTVNTGETSVITGWDDRLDKAIFAAEHQAEWVRIFTPITIRQEHIGVVEAGFSRSRDMTIKDSQIRLLRAFIDQAALALDNAQRYEASQKTARREALIRDITTKVRASTDVDTILQTAVKEVGEAFQSKRAYIHLASTESLLLGGTPIGGEVG